jgi:hypothetical protein
MSIHIYILPHGLLVNGYFCPSQAHDDFKDLSLVRQIDCALTEYRILKNVPSIVDAKEIFLHSVSPFGNHLEILTSLMYMYTRKGEIPIHTDNGVQLDTLHFPSLKLARKFVLQYPNKEALFLTGDEHDFIYIEGFLCKIITPTEEEEEEEEEKS